MKKCGRGGGGKDEKRNAFPKIFRGDPEKGGGKKEIENSGNQDMLGGQGERKEEKKKKTEEEEKGIHRNYALLSLKRLGTEWQKGKGKKKKKKRGGGMVHSTKASKKKGGGTSDVPRPKRFSRPCRHAFEKNGKHSKKGGSLEIEKNKRTF